MERSTMAKRWMVCFYLLHVTIRPTPTPPRLMWVIVSSGCHWSVKDSSGFWSLILCHRGGRGWGAGDGPRPILPRDPVKWLHLKISPVSHVSTHNCWDLAVGTWGPRARSYGVSDVSGPWMSDDPPVFLLTLGVWVRVANLIETWRAPRLTLCFWDRHNKSNKGGEEGAQGKSRHGVERFITASQTLDVYFP